MQFQLRVLCYYSPSFVDLIIEEAVDPSSPDHRFASPYCYRCSEVQTIKVTTLGIMIDKFVEI